MLFFMVIFSDCLPSSGPGDSKLKMTAELCVHNRTAKPPSRKRVVPVTKSDFLQGRLLLPALGKIDFHGQRRNSQRMKFIQHVLVLLFVTRKNGYRRSSFSQTQRDTAADATVAAGYDSDASA
jgi:hypothetical protein